MSTNPVLVMPASFNTNGMRRREILWRRENKKCFWCGCPTRLSKDHAWDTATDDHVIPRYKGGTNDVSNLVSACNRCNNRRNHEDSLKLAEGALLGKYKMDSNVPSPNAGKKIPNHNPPRVALTKDEKKAIIAGGTVVAKVPAYQTHIEQRDQALKEIKKLREQKGILESDQMLHKMQIQDKDAALVELAARMQEMTVWYLIRKKIAAWLLR